jgi:transcriptional regulator with XRE-family HTH domain
MRNSSELAEAASPLLDVLATCPVPSAAARGFPTRQDRAALITGADLRKAREEAGVGLDRLSRIIGKSKGHLSQVERGLRDVNGLLVRGYEQALKRKIVPDSDPTRREPVGCNLNDAFDPRAEPHPERLKLAPALDAHQQQLIDSSSAGTADSVDEMLNGSVRESEVLLAARPDAVELDLLQETVARLGRVS